MADWKAEKRILPDASGMGCEEWAVYLPEAMDGHLPDHVAPLFERHRAGCEACRRSMEEARQGLAWLELLKEEPETPPDLLQAILAGAGPQAASPPQSAGLPALHSPAPSSCAARRRSAWPAAPPVRRWLESCLESCLESRAMMTVAMAIFSLAVTLRAASARPAVVNLAEAQPAELSAILSRRYFAAHERIAKYCENLKVVREMEVGVRDFKEPDGPNDAPAPASRPSVPPRAGAGAGVDGVERLRESLGREIFALRRDPGVGARPGNRHENREGNSGAEVRGV